MGVRKTDKSPIWSPMVSQQWPSQSTDDLSKMAASFSASAVLPKIVSFPTVEAAGDVVGREAAWMFTEPRGSPFAFQGKQDAQPGIN